MISSVGPKPSRRLTSSEPELGGCAPIVTPLAISSCESWSLFASSRTSVETGIAGVADARLRGYATACRNVPWIIAL
jgi:hypothetical protein